MIVLLALVSSVIVYWRDKKRLYVLSGVSVLSILLMVGTFLIGPSQSNERNESVDQIIITTEYINLRTKSSRKGEIIGLVYEGEIYTVLDVAEEKDYT